MMMGDGDGYDCSDVGLVDDDDVIGKDDIYIMMKCLSVCFSRKIITSHFRAEPRKHELSSPLGLAGRRPALA